MNETKVNHTRTTNHVWQKIDNQFQTVKKADLQLSTDPEKRERMALEARESVVNLSKN